MSNITAETALSSTSVLPITTRRQEQLLQRKLAYQDLFDSLKQWRIWLVLAYQEVKLRYRRSVLGPFWLTLSMAITSYSMGYLYGHLFHTDLQSYFPFLVAGMLTWALISSQISDLTEALSSAEGLIKQIKLPYSLYIHKVAARNFIIFFHNIIVIVPIIAIFHQVAKINFNTLLILPGLLLLYVNSILYGLILAMVGARYRDIAQIVKSLIQVAFFLTPVMWNPNILPAKDWYIIGFNPFYAFVELIRSPLLGMHPSLATICMALVITLFGFMLCMAMFSRYRSRIVYWV